MDIVLIDGLWLDASTWDEVVATLDGLGHRAVAVTLPGQGDGRSCATLEQQAAAVVAAVDSASQAPLVVAHSAACTLGWLAADARPERVSRLVLIGGFPAGDGKTYADYFPISDGVMPFPGWGPFEGPDIADLDEDLRRRVADAAVPVPEQVAKGEVRLTDERRYGVPIVLVCPEYSPEEARGWIDAGEVPEIAKAERVEFVDLDSGHWPMFSKPVELARLLDRLAAQV